MIMIIDVFFTCINISPALRKLFEYGTTTWMLSLQASSDKSCECYCNKSNICDLLVLQNFTSFESQNCIQNASKQ